MQIKDFHNKHKGKLAFVLGSGPSLHFEKLEGIERYVSFAVNTAILKLKTADYFVTNDSSVTDWDYFLHSLPKLKGTVFMPSDPLVKFDHHFDKQKSCFYDHKFTYDLQKRNVASVSFELTEDPEQPIIGVGSSSCTAVHIAHIMGCNPIVLLGVDCCYITDRHYFWQFPGEAKPKRIKGVPFPTRKQLIKNKTVDDHNREILEHWNTFGRCNPHANVINASTQGLVDCIPKMSYGDVIARYGALTK